MDQPLRVLIVEDSEDDTHLLLRELRRSGFAVKFERVETAEVMQSALTQKTWDLIMSDYTLREQRLKSKATLAWISMNSTWLE